MSQLNAQTLAIVAGKKLLRKQIMSKLSSLPKNVIQEQSLESFNILKNTKIFKEAKSIGVFMSMDTEIKTSYILKEAFDCGKDVYLPRIETQSQDQITLYKNGPHYVMFYKMDNYNSCINLPQVGKYKLQEPSGGVCLLNDHPYGDKGLDLLIMPGVAFTSDLNRLGHGGGFYDDFLKRYKDTYGKHPFLLGIGLGDQLVDEIPTDIHDEKLDGLIIRDKLYGNDSL